MVLRSTQVLPPWRFLLAGLMSALFLLSAGVGSNSAYGQDDDAKDTAKSRAARARTKRLRRKQRRMKRRQRRALRRQRRRRKRRQARRKARAKWSVAKRRAMAKRRVWLRARWKRGWYRKPRWSKRYHDPVLTQCGRKCRGRLYQRNMKHRRINRLLRHLQDTYSYHKRLRILSGMFLGGLYRLGPLGEGRQGRFDRDPIFRFDRVDCVTYVETVMALAMSRSVPQAIRAMQKVRYKNGKIRYSHRNHFTATQWLAENEKAGYLQTITEQVGRPYIKYIDRKITAETWEGTSWRRRIPASLLPRSYRFAYIPLRHIPKVIQKLPNIAWMGEVKDDPGNPVAVQHVGFVVRKGKRVVFRDANIMPGVSDRTLTAYTRWRLRQHKEPNRRYTIVGYAFAAFKDINKKSQ